MDVCALFGHQAELPPPAAPLGELKLPGHGAVYALVDDTGRLIQLLSAQNLRRSAVLRLRQPLQPAQSRRADLRSIARRICWTPTHSPFESALEYLRAARVLLPDRYREQLGFGPVWFAHVDPFERLPRWTPQTIAYRGGIDAGPFDRRSLCTEFIEMLEDLFELCRYHHILEQTPYGVPCAYFEMGKCPAPCNGSISLEQYRQMIRDSVAFARGVQGPHLARLHDAMQAAARDLRFERAAGIRQSLERARKLLAHPGRLADSAADFVYVVLQRGAKTSLVRPFFVDCGTIQRGADVKIRAIEPAAPAWIEWLDSRRTADALDARPPADGSDAVAASECVWLVSHFLMKGDAPPRRGLFLRRSALEAEPPAPLVERIRAHFARRPAVAPAGGAPAPDDISPSRAD